MENALPFDPSEPFPAINPELVPLSAAATHAAKVDRYFGIPVMEAEAAHLARAKADSFTGLEDTPSEHWVGLPPHALLTPYTEISFLLDVVDLAPGDKLVELGSGYARTALVMAEKKPDCEYIGFEVVPERFFSSKILTERFNLMRAHVYLEDLSQADLPLIEASHYFIYDFGTAPAIELVLEKLKKIAQKRPVQVIARGRRSRDLIERGHPWLALVHEPKHFKNFSIYFTAQRSR